MRPRPKRRVRVKLAEPFMFRVSIPVSKPLLVKGANHMHHKKLFLITILFPAVTALAVEPPEGLWRGWLDCPGGEIPFHFALQRDGDKWSGWLINDPDRAAIPKVTWNGTELVLDITHYDSVLRAKPNAAGDQWDGTWRKRSKADKWVEMPFHAKPGNFPRFVRLGFFSPAFSVLAGKWSVKFASEEDPAIATFTVSTHGEVTGTLLTTTGDYGYLAGIFNGDNLRLSNFDGAHAFLFIGRMQEDGTLTGKFWSRDAFVDTWTAIKDPTAQLPDAFEMTKGVDNADLAKVAFPDVNGKSRSLTDPDLAGKARVIEVFGTWCPNCHDASHYLADLHRRFRDRGLVVVGLAFELTGDVKRDTEQVKIFADRHKVEYPLLVAGISDREKASASLPMLDKLRAYPTLIVLDGKGKVRAVYTGFSGPATGEAYTAFQTKFESLIEHLLAE
jgi:peroxiredoxin